MDMLIRRRKFTILSSHKFTEPFKKPIEYANEIAEITNLFLY